MKSALHIGQGSQKPRRKRRRLPSLLHHAAGEPQLPAFTIPSAGPVERSTDTHAVQIATLLERHKLGRRGGTNTGPTVPHGLVRNAELGEVVADHVGLDLNG